MLDEDLDAAMQTLQLFSAAKVTLNSPKNSQFNIVNDGHRSDVRGPSVGRVPEFRSRANMNPFLYLIYLTVLTNPEEGLTFFHSVSN